jgi:hypothetical protein
MAVQAPATVIWEILVTYRPTNMELQDSTSLTTKYNLWVLTQLLVAAV